MSAPDHEVTELLRAWGEGDLSARDRLMPLVYDELRRRGLPASRGVESDAAADRARP